MRTFIPRPAATAFAYSPRISADPPRVLSADRGTAPSWLMPCSPSVPNPMVVLLALYEPHGTWVEGLAIWTEIRRDGIQRIGSSRSVSPTVTKRTPTLGSRQ